MAIDLQTLFQSLSKLAQAPVGTPEMQAAAANPVLSADDMKRQAVAKAITAMGASMAQGGGNLFSALGKGMATGATGFMDDTDPQKRTQALIKAFGDLQAQKKDQMAQQATVLNAGGDVNTDQRSAVKNAFDMSTETKRLGLEADRDAVLNKSTTQGMEISAAQEGRAAEDAAYIKGQRPRTAELAAQTAADTAVNSRAKALGLDRPLRSDATPEQQADRAAANQQLSDYQDQVYQKYGVRIPGTKTKPAQPASQKDFDAMKPGEYFINPKDGKLMVKK